MGPRHGDPTTLRGRIVARNQTSVQEAGRVLIQCAHTGYGRPNVSGRQNAFADDRLVEEDLAHIGLFRQHRRMNPPSFAATMFANWRLFTLRENECHLFHRQKSQHNLVTGNTEPDQVIDNPTLNAIVLDAHVRIVQGHIDQVARTREPRSQPTCINS